MSTSHSDQIARIRALENELKEYRRRAEDAEESLRAISSGQVDALMVNTEKGAQVFMLEGADRAYRIWMEKVQEGIATITQDGMFLYANQYMAGLLDISLERVPGANISSFIDIPDQLYFMNLLQRAPDKPGRGELVLRQMSGRAIPIHLSLTVIPAEKDQLICVVVNDLTEQKQVNEILASEQMARMILDQVSEIVVVCDSLGNIIRSSRAAQELIPIGILGKPFNEVFQFISTGEGSSSVIQIEPVLRGAAYSGIEVTFQPKKRTGEEEPPTRHFLLSANPLRSENEEIIGCIISLVDITSRKRLEHSIHARTEQLKASLHDLESFAYSMSHDLRTPLRAINGYATLIDQEEKDSLTEETRMYLRNLRLATNHMGELIDDLLQFTRVARTEVHRRPVSLERLFKNVITDLNERIVQSGASVVFPPQSELPIIHSDPYLLYQILINIIQNSLVYHRPGARPEVQISYSSNPNEDILSVRDNGIGIPLEYQERIFRVFERLHTDHEIPGTGIGLAIVKRAVELLGGTVWVESELEQGSTFWVALPKH